MKSPFDPVALPRVFLDRPIAHRALHDAAAGVIENSPAAIRRAVVAGYAIEIDVQLSADGVAMVFHDDDLARLTGEPGAVRSRTAAELGQLRLTGSDDTIPTLADMLSLIDGAVPLVIEIKDQTGCFGPGDDTLERAVAADVKGYPGPVAVMSFNPHCVSACAEHLPKLPRGLVSRAFAPENWPNLSPETLHDLRETAAFDRVGASFVSHQAADLTRPRIAALKARGVPIICWTVTTPEGEAQARRIADNITFERYRPALTVLSD